MRDTHTRAMSTSTRSGIDRKQPRDVVDRRRFGLLLFRTGSPVGKSSRVDYWSRFEVDDRLSCFHCKNKNRPFSIHFSLDSTKPINATTTTTTTTTTITKPKRNERYWMSAPLIFPIPIFLSASRPPSSNSTRERAKQRADSRRPKETRRRRRRREGGVRENRKEKEKKRPAAICWLRSRPQESHAARYTIIARPNKVTRPPCDCIGPFLDPLRCLRCLVFLPSFLPFILLLLASHSALALGPRLSPRYTHTHTHKCHSTWYFVVDEAIGLQLSLFLWFFTRRSARSSSSTVRFFLFVKKRTFRKEQLKRKTKFLYFYFFCSLIFELENKNRKQSNQKY